MCPFVLSSDRRTECQGSLHWLRGRHRLAQAYDEYSELVDAQATLEAHRARPMSNEKRSKGLGYAGADVPVWPTAKLFQRR